MATNPATILRLESRRRWWLFAVTILCVGGFSLALQEKALLVTGDKPGRSASAFAAIANNTPAPAGNGPAAFVARVLDNRGPGGRSGRSHRVGGAGADPTGAPVNLTPADGGQPAPGDGAPLPGPAAPQSFADSGAPGGAGGSNPGIIAVNSPGTGSGGITDFTNPNPGGGSSGGGGDGNTPGGVPEPETWALILVGLAVTGFAARRKLKAIA